MTAKVRSKLSLGLALALILSLLFTSVAMADDISNNLDASVDAVSEVMPLNVGGANGTTTLYLVERNGDGKNGCNLTGQTTLVVTVNTSDTSVATVSPSSVTFTSCGFTQVLTVTPHSQGSATISLTQTSNNTGGTFDLSPATFTVNVAPPPNTPPQISISGVTGGASYEIGSVPAASCQVTDAEDGNSSFAASLSDVTGPLSAYGLGEQTASCSYTDGGGLTAAASVTYGIVDTTGPVITFVSQTPEANANGWNNSDVTVTWSCTDSGSGVVDTTVSQTVSTEGANQSATGTCEDHAGNKASDTQSGINIDKTAPTNVILTPTGDAGENGWFVGDVTITTTGTDDISGVTCSEVQYLTTESKGAEFKGSCTNGAGLKTDATPITVKMDESAPMNVELLVTAGTAGSNGWYTTDVTVSTKGTDEISGVTCTADQFQTVETAGTQFVGTCTNGAGLKTDAAPLTVKLDKTGPTAELKVTVGTQGNNGWYTSDVTVSTSGTDSISSPVTCSADQYQKTDTDGTIFNGSCTNDAGLTTNAASLTVKLDKMSPGITWNGSINDGDSFYFGFVPSQPTCTATDSLSGPDSCNVTGYGTTLGSHTLTATAYDKAGNKKEESRSYTVLAWTLKGFYQPVDMNGVINTVKNGSTVPLKFEIFAGSTEITDLSAVVSLMYGQVTCNVTTPTDEIETVATGGTALRYDLAGGQFIYNWKTPTRPGNCYRVTMTALDGSTLAAFFKLK